MVTWASFAQVTINFSPAERGPEIGDRHYGIFFEEINHAGDGGLYAELIRNRSFEDNEYSPESWQTYGNASLDIVFPSTTLTPAQRLCGSVNVPSGSTGGLMNEGFWGINIVEGATYDLSFWICLQNYGTKDVSIEALLLDKKEQSVIGKHSKTVQLTGGSDVWKKIEMQITATGSDPKGLFALNLSAGSYFIDMVSLFPTDTYKGRKNGCRRDLAEKLEAMHPAFVRFPGGCYVEGEWRNDKPEYDNSTWTYGSTNRFQWKKTIGALEERPGHWNINWNYRVSDGLGFHEMLQLTEDLGAEPLFVVNMGMGHGWYVDYNYIDEYIQEALDAIEYCNGDASTKYGAMRIANGHEAPFNLRLIEIGNENYNFTSYDNRDQSDHYAERYIQFYNAIKAKYPEVTCIGNVEAWGTDNPSWRNSHPVDAVDEHYYRNPGWFVSQYEKYDHYDRATMKKVYAGEYAVTQDCSSIGDLKSALGEAVYMQGMENNSDICIMGSYAPIFVNENDQKWLPDMIRFNSSESYGTPSYYVQQLMPTYVGKQNIKWTEQNNVIGAEEKRSGLSTWITSAVFENYKINGQPVDFTTNWTAPSQGIWSVTSSNTLTQASTTMEGAVYVCETPTGDDYTIEVDATKTGGNEGFLIAFNYIDSNNYTWLNLGGWGNTKHAIEVCQNGAKQTVASCGGYLENGRTYHIKVVVSGGNIAQCYVDDELLFTTNIAGSKQRKVYVSSSINDETGKLYVKLVNPNGEAQKTTINLKDYAVSGGKIVQMKHEDPNAVNNTANQTNVVPTESKLYVAGSSFEIDVPAYSFNILELNIVDANQQNTPVADGIYYIYNKEKDAFLSRGADWGTRATLDNYGVPVQVINTEEGTLLKYLDETRNMYLGYDTHPYTDKAASAPVTWTLKQHNYGPYVLLVNGKDLWLTDQGVNQGCTFNASEGNATEFYFITNEEYKTIMAQREVITADNCRAYDVTHLIENPTMATDMSGWDVTFSGNTATRSNLTEAFEKFGGFYQTLTGLTPGTYRFTLQGFYRGSSNANCCNIANNGYTLSNAYIFANDSQSRLKTWAEDRESDFYPNSMEETWALISQGKYQNEVICRVGDDGVLTIGMQCPQRNVSGWLIWGNATLTQLVEPVDYTDHIINPSFEYSLSQGWTNNGMQRQSNTEPKAGKTGTYYCERWTQAPGVLPDTYVSQTVTGLPNGDYEITAYCHAENQSYAGLEAEGVYLFAGDSKTYVSEPGLYKVRVSAFGGELNIGFACESTNANWITVDNFRLAFLGNSNAGMSSSLKNAMEKLQDVLAEKNYLLPDDMKKSANALLANANNLLADETATADDYTTAIENLKAMTETCAQYRLNIERNDPYARYLFTYFPNNSNENLYYAVSEDAFNYTPLNNGERIMASDTVSIKGGIRDPHILRGADGKTFYMVATDMRCAEGWDSNRGIVMYKSTDMIHWQHSTVHFPDRFPALCKNVTRVWAPETIWDANYDNGDGTKGRYMVYFSLLTRDGQIPYDKVFYCYANDDFTDLITEPVFLYDRGSATIDANIMYDECDKLYHMIYKNEGSGGICSVTAHTLTAPKGAEPGSQWSKPSGTLQQTSMAVEGGGLFRMIDSNTWVMMYDCYANGYYQFCTTTDWKNFTLEAQTYTYGAFTPRHGTVIPVTAHEYNELLKAFPTDGLTLIEEVANGISEVKNEELGVKNLNYYNLLGQKVSNATKGITIMNGKKMQQR